MVCKKVVAFLGREGSGKSYQSNELIKRGYKKLSFANPLRKLAFKVVGLDFEEGMKQYDTLKRTELVFGMTFRNILEQLGEGVRAIDSDFWIKALVNDIRGTLENICIDDMRYPNEFIKLHDYCKEHGIEFKAYLCNYNSERYSGVNPHSSAKLANYLVDELHMADLQEVDYNTIATFESNNKTDKLEEELALKVKELLNGRPRR